MTPDDRLARVERELNDLKDLHAYGLMAVGVAFVALAVLTMLTRPGQNGTMRARRYDMIDDNGQVRATLTALNNQTGLLVLDENGKAILIAPTREPPNED